MDNRQAAAKNLADDLLVFVEDATMVGGDPDLQIRAKVLVARVDLEQQRLEKREAMSNQELAAELGMQHGDD